MEYLFPIIFFSFFGFVIFMIFSKKGKEVIFGGKIVKTMDPVTKGKKRMLISSNLKVHIIENSLNGRNIGLEISQSGVLNYSMVPVVLPISEAKILADTIYAAIDFDEHQAHGVGK